MARKTGAEAYRDEGRQEEAVRSRQEILLRQLRRLFKDVPAAMEAVIRQSADVDQLDAWLDLLVTTKTLAEVVTVVKG